MLPPDFDAPALAQALQALPPTPAAAEAAHAEAYWDSVRALYDVTRPPAAPANLENGFWGVMAEPVRAEFERWTLRVNRESTLLMRGQGQLLLEAVRAQVAEALGCGLHEVALTRGATEAMLALIGGYQRLRPGDEVMYCDLDYPAMRHSMQWLESRRGVRAVRLVVPEPATRAGVLQLYEQALARHPRTKLLLLTHLSHATGLVMPVKDIGEMARAMGADVVVDAAHSWGQMDFRAADLGAPFVAFNLHKWIGAPLGCGCLYIRDGQVDRIERYFGTQDFGDDDVRARIHTGSPNFAAWLSIPAALQLHARIGPAAKAARLQALRARWVQPARDIPGLQVMTPDGPGEAAMSAGITSFRLDGHTSTAANQAIVQALQAQHGVFTVQRPGPAAGDVVRVTPAIYTPPAELDSLAEALRTLASSLRASAAISAGAAGAPR